MFDFLRSFLGKPEVTPEPKKREKLESIVSKFPKQSPSTWTMSGSRSANAMVEASARAQREKNRELEESNPYFSRWLADLESNVLGDNGVVMKAKVRGKNRKLKVRLNKAIQDAWRQASRPGNFDMTGRLSRRAFDALTLRSVARDGDSGMRFVRGRIAKNKFAFAVAGYESEQIPHTHHTDISNDRVVRMGVERDEWHRHYAYYLDRGHPGEIQMRRQEPNNPIRVRAESAPSEGNDDGSSMVLVFAQTRFNQDRGVSWAKVAVKQLEQLGLFEEAALITKRVAAAKAAFITPDEDADDDPDDDGGFDGNYTGPDGRRMLDLTPGTIEYLERGESIETVDWNRPDEGLPDFRKAMLRGVCAGLLCNYNVLANDLEGTSFASIRQGVLSERELYRIIQAWWIDTVEFPRFKAWLEMQALTGTIPGLTMADVDEVMESVEFAGRRWAWVDPLKDMQAAVLGIENGLASRDRETRKMGEDVREIAEELEEEQKLFDFMQGSEKTKIDPPDEENDPDYKNQGEAA